MNEELASSREPIHQIPVGPSRSGASRSRCKVRSRGAFTWSVLDRLLAEQSLEIVGISGTSAGAMNAGLLADGLRRGGASHARG